MHADSSITSRQTLTRRRSSNPLVVVGSRSVAPFCFRDATQPGRDVDDNFDAVPGTTQTLHLCDAQPSPLFDYLCPSAFHHRRYVIGNLLSWRRRLLQITASSDAVHLPVAPSLLAVLLSTQRTLRQLSLYFCWSYIVSTSSASHRPILHFTLTALSLGAYSKLMYCAGPLAAWRIWTQVHKL